MPQRLPIAAPPANPTAIGPTPVVPFRAPRALPTARERLLLSPPHLTGGELVGLQDMLASGWVAPGGPMTEAFERALVEATGLPHVAAVASGTAALKLGYRALGVEPDDEVWTATLTFVATAAPAKQMGARLRFLDVARESWTLDPAILEAELARAARRGRLPRVVVPVDLFGQCSDLRLIRTLCDRWGVPVLSDSAAALGATHRGGRGAGGGAQLAAFSFNGNKIVTAGGGGALAAEDASQLARIRKLAAQAKEPAAHYQHEETGYSDTMSSVLAAVGLAQLSELPARVAARRSIFDRYAEALSALPGVCPMPEPAWGRSNRWLSAFLFDPDRGGPDREAVRQALEAAGIESRPVWKPLHLQPAFRGCPAIGGAVAAGLFERGLCLPSGTGMTVAEQQRVIDVIQALAGG